MSEMPPSSQSTRNVMAKELYRPIAIRFTKKNGSEAQCNLACGLTFKDIVLVLACYVTFYSFLLGFCAILLKGAMDTAESSTLLWTFFIVGLMFGGAVAVAIKMGTKAQDEQKAAKRQAEEEEALRRIHEVAP